MILIFHYEVLTVEPWDLIPIIAHFDIFFPVCTMQKEREEFA